MSSRKSVSDSPTRTASALTVRLDWPRSVTRKNSAEPRLARIATKNRMTTIRTPPRRENRRHPVLRRDPRKPRLGAVFPGDRPRPVQAHGQGARGAGRAVADALPAAHGRLL